MVQEATTNVVGGGSTFAAPLMDYLSTNYQVQERTWIIIILLLAPFYKLSAIFRFLVASSSTRWWR
jgi:phage terminase large subunit-like protein